MQIITNSEEETFKLGRRISALLKGGEVIGLEGELGSGKTILVKGIAAGLGFDRDKVVSSSFVLIREYPARVPLYHFDLYRLKDRREFAELGYEDYFFAKGISVVEWSDKIEGLMPEDALIISFEITGIRKRKIVFSAANEHHRGMIRKIEKIHDL